MKRPSGSLRLERNSLWWFCILALSIFLLVLTSINSPMIIESAKKFGVSTSGKPMTELYFSDHSSLSRSLQVGGELLFDVTMASREFSSTVFNFEVIESDESGMFAEILKSGSVTLTPGEKREFEISVLPRLISPRSKILVRATRISNSNHDLSIGSSDLQIHFWTERK